MTALYEVKPLGEAVTGDLGIVRLRWLDPDTSAPREAEQAISTSSLAPSFEMASPRFQLDVVVAQYAEVLRESIWARQIGSDLNEVAGWSDQVARALPEDPDVAELAGLIRQAAAIDSR